MLLVITLLNLQRSDCTKPRDKIVSKLTCESHDVEILNIQLFHQC